MPINLYKTEVQQEVLVPNSSNHRKLSNFKLSPCFDDNRKFPSYKFPFFNFRKAFYLKEEQTLVKFKKLMQYQFVKITSVVIQCINFETYSSTRN